jgi:hypothetical protein
LNGTPKDGGAPAAVRTRARGDRSRLGGRADMSRLPHDRIQQILELEIETLALSEAELIARVAELETDIAVYRELTVAAFDALRHLTDRYDRANADLHALRDENVRLVDEACLRAGADDDVQGAAA